ncbi:MAG TPA: hypothetical protein VK966_06170 [Longimicrobiales bacterium]|nr:hypothetical protein [Longimicrobiales bacterium]
MNLRRIGKIFGIGVLSTVAVATLGVLFVRDQMSRHRRDLFSSRPLRRLAALGYIAGAPPTVDSVRLLRDYIAWEPQPLIRRKAAQVLSKMERSLREAVLAREEVAG